MLVFVILLLVFYILHLLGVERVRWLEDDRLRSRGLDNGVSIGGVLREEILLNIVLVDGI